MVAKAEHTAPEWQTAMQALMFFATAGRGPTMLARIGIMKALSGQVPQTFNETPSKKTRRESASPREIARLP